MDDGITRVAYEITQALLPFRPGEMQMSVYDHTPDLNTTRIEIRIEAMPLDLFVMEVRKIYLFESKLALLAREIGVQAGLYFASVPSLPVGANVELGEN